MSKVFEIREYDKEKSFNNYIEKSYRDIESNREIITLRSRVENIISSK